MQSKDKTRGYQGRKNGDRGKRRDGGPQQPSQHEKKKHFWPRQTSKTVQPPIDPVENEASREAQDDGIIRLFGIHAVEAALLNPMRTFRRLQLTDNAENRLEATLKSRGLTHERVQPKDLDRRLGSETVHQGALLETDPLPSPSLEDLAARAATKGPLIVLDQVTDPHNVGAILRSAAVLGAAGLVMTIRNSPPLAGALAKSASGALEHIPIALVTNLSRALTELAELGLHRIGLEGEAETTLETNSLGANIALVLGAEGKGLRRLTREHCDELARIVTDGPMRSLNVSNATAIALHLSALRRRQN